MYTELIICDATCQEEIVCTDDVKDSSPLLTPMDNDYRKSIYKYVLTELKAYFCQPQVSH